MSLNFCPEKRRANGKSCRRERKHDLFLKWYVGMFTSIAPPPKPFFSSLVPLQSLSEIPLETLDWGRVGVDLNLKGLAVKCSET
eukprot:1849432-Amphidinium_carterae.1